MTLIIGVRCDNGIVIGSDGITTRPTVEQKTGSKIHDDIGKAVLFAAAGDVGIGQDVLRGLIHKSRQISKQNSKYHVVKNLIANTISSEIGSYVKRIEDTLIVADRSSLSNEQNVITRADFKAVIATRIDNEPYLFDIDQHGNLLDITPELVFTTIGSGESQAYPFLEFVKRTAWNGGQPNTIVQGILGVWWTLKYVTAGNASIGVGEPFSIGVLEQVGGIWEASILKSDRLLTYDEDIRDVELALRKHLNREVDTTDPPLRPDEPPD